MPSSPAATRGVPALPRHQLVVAGGGGVQGRRLEAARGDRQGAGRAGGSSLTGGDRGGEQETYFGHKYRYTFIHNDKVQSARCTPEVFKPWLALQSQGIAIFNFMDYTTISQYLNCCNFQEKL